MIVLASSGCSKARGRDRAGKSELIVSPASLGVQRTHPQSLRRWERLTRDWTIPARHLVSEQHTQDKYTHDTLVFAGVKRPNKQ